MFGLEPQPGGGCALAQPLDHGALDLPAVGGVDGLHDLYGLVLVDVADEMRRPDAIVVAPEVRSYAGPFGRDAVLLDADDRARIAQRGRQQGRVPHPGLDPADGPSLIVTLRGGTMY